MQLCILGTVAVGIDEARVGAWLESHVHVIVPPFVYRSIGGGRSNLTFLVSDAGGREVVLRRPPTGHVLATAHDMRASSASSRRSGRPPFRCRRR